MELVKCMNKEKLLKEYFGFNEFRYPQDQIIDSVVQGEDVISLLPTGYGKSIVFQVSALLLKHLTIIITPLIALMEDQVMHLKKKGISAVAIHSNLSLLEQDIIYKGILKQKYKMIYIAPERLQNLKFIKVIKEHPVSLLVVDEAHTILWGESFRSSFLHIKKALNSFTIRPVVLALTATATSNTIAKIVNYLGLNQPKLFRIPMDRKNLYFSVICTKDKFFYLINYLKKFRDQKGILYCLTRRTVETLWHVLKTKGYSVTFYHGGMDVKQKNINQQLFTKGLCNLMISTNAFGMGIDIPDIRFVLQYDTPQSIEDLVQQIGRASRDGVYGEGVLLFSFSDLRQSEYFIQTIQQKQVRKQEIKKLEAVVDYALTTKCRHSWISKYFGQTVNPCNCMCDNCKKSR